MTNEYSFSTLKTEIVYDFKFVNNRKELGNKYDSWIKFINELEGEIFKGHIPLPEGFNKVTVVRYKLMQVLSRAYDAQLILLDEWFWNSDDAENRLNLEILTYKSLIYTHQKRLKYEDVRESTLKELKFYRRVLNEFEYRKRKLLNK